VRPLQLTEEGVGFQREQRYNLAQYRARGSLSYCCQANELTNMPYTVVQHLPLLLSPCFTCTELTSIPKIGSLASITRGGQQSRAIIC
jgi:hypothetical protein